MQEPGKSYEFNGGSILTFKEAPKLGDKVSLIFYKGTAGTDVISREILETVRSGDNLKINNDSSIDQSQFLQEDDRTVNSIESTDFVKTLPYFGPGNTTDESLLRPVTLTRQTEDIILNGIGIGKDREIYEPVINPVSYVIKTVDVGISTVYVDNIKPIFDSQNENSSSLNFQKNVTFTNQGLYNVGAAATAVVSAAGTITSLTITNIGYGYATAPVISIASTTGIDTTTRATASATIGVGGTISDISITNPGVGYTQSNPPIVIISPPPLIKETSKVTTYSGDNGIIVGFGTTTINVTGVGTTGESVNIPTDTNLIFDLHIPYNSDLRNSSLVGTAITLSSLDVDDYVVVSNTNSKVVGMSSFISLDSSGRIGICSQFTDAVLNIKSTEIISKNIVGITTFVKRIHSRIIPNIEENLSSTKHTLDSTLATFDTGADNYAGTISTSNYFGNYGWGKVDLSGSLVNQFNSYSLGEDGLSGITTSDIVTRTNRLRFKNYVS